MPDDDEKPHAPPSGYEVPSSRRPTSAEGSLEQPRTRHDPYAAFRYRAFGFYSAGNVISVIGRLMLFVAVEWEIYERTNSATALGLVGLAIALPVVLLSLPAGHIADRYSRKSIILWSQAISAVCSLALAWVSLNHLNLPAWPILQSGNNFLHSVASVFERQTNYRFDDLSLPLIYLILLISATGRTFGWAARSAYFPRSSRGKPSRTPSPGIAASFRLARSSARQSAACSSCGWASRLSMRSMRFARFRSSFSWCPYEANIKVDESRAVRGRACWKGCDSS